MREGENDTVFYDRGRVVWREKDRYPVDGLYEVDDLGLDRRTRNALIRNGLTTHASIAFFMERDLLARVRNIGKEREQKIREHLQRRLP